MDHIIEEGDEESESFATLFEGDWQSAMEGFIGAMVPAEQPDLRRRLLRDVSAQDAEVAVAVLRSYPQVNMGQTLADCPCPVRAINAPMPPTSLSSNRSLDPDFEVEILDGLGHFLLLEDPQRFHGALDRALAALGYEL